MLSLIEQVRAAQRRQGWSVQRLLDASRLPIERSSLQRKLSGEVPTTTSECQALASALGLNLAWIPSEAA